MSLSKQSEFISSAAICCLQSQLRNLLNEVWDARWLSLGHKRPVRDAVKMPGCVRSAVCVAEVQGPPHSADP